MSYAKRRLDDALAKKYPEPDSVSKADLYMLWNRFDSNDHQANRVMEALAQQLFNEPLQQIILEIENKILGVK